MKIRTIILSMIGLALGVGFSSCSVRNSTKIIPDDVAAVEAKSLQASFDKTPKVLFVMKQTDSSFELNSINNDIIGHKNVGLSSDADEISNEDFVPFTITSKLNKEPTFTVGNSSEDDFCHSVTPKYSNGIISFTITQDITKLTTCSMTAQIGQYQATLPLVFTKTFYDWKNCGSCDIEKNILNIIDTRIVENNDRLDLSITQNSTYSIPGGIFAGFTALKTLIIYGTYFSPIHDYAFAGLTLDSLDLQYLYNWKNFSANTFAGLETKELDLRNNVFSFVPDQAFSSLTSLDYLYLDSSDSNILANSIPDSAFANNVHCYEKLYTFDGSGQLKRAPDKCLTKPTL